MNDGTDRIPALPKSFSAYRAEVGSSPVVSEGGLPLLTQLLRGFLGNRTPGIIIPGDSGTTDQRLPYRLRCNQESRAEEGCRDHASQDRGRSCMGNPGADHYT